MKKLIFTLFIIHCSLLIANAQWILQHSSNSGYSFHHVAFINRYTGWVCGDGVIKKTTNEGNNWISQTHPAMDKNLYCILPVDSQVVYCVGWWETILKTTNGGTNWIAIRNGPYGTGSSYFSTSFINKDTGWFIGTGFKLLKTTNGCQSFDSISLFSIYATFDWDMKFKDANTGIFVGDGGQVFKSTNGGYNWFHVNIPLNDTLSNFYKMSVYQNQYCYLAGNGGRIFSSSDFGSNWTRVTKIQLQNQNELYCCNFVNLNTGWAGGTTGVLYKTTNGGYNWQRENTHNDQTYNASIWFYDTLIGWVVGGGGKILHTTTGGEPLGIAKYEDIYCKDFELYQNCPNPFNNQTTIEFSINKNNNYQLIIYDLLGRQIEIIFKKYLTNGKYKVTYNSNELSSGMYFYVLESDGIKINKRFILLK
jgi:photosystem II stability/assembly factor-like uncharacterized protein